MEMVQEEGRQLGHIGRNIKFIRELRGMNQKGVARELGMSQQAVSHMEKSDTLDAELLSELSEILGVSPEFILNTGDLVTAFLMGPDTVKKVVPKRESKPQDLKKIVELYERLVNAEKEKVAYLEMLLDRNSLRERPSSYAVLKMA